MSTIDRLWPEGAETGDQPPEEWGRLFWAMLHEAAAQTVGNPDARAELIRMLATLGDVLPCTACRKCFRAHFGTQPPTGDVGLWLRNLQQSVAKRQELVAPTAPQGPRPPPAGTSDAELAQVMAYALRAAAGRSREALVKWTRVFREFVRRLCVVMPPPPGGTIEMVARNLSYISRLEYDLRAFLQACLVATCINQQAAAPKQPRRRAIQPVAAVRRQAQRVRYGRGAQPETPGPGRTVRLGKRRGGGVNVMA
jgi:hypothetical protein